MKEELLTHLMEGEELLFYGKSDVSKTAKQYGRFLIFIVVLSITWFLTLYFEAKSLILYLFLIFMTGFILYGLIYNTFLKYKSKNNEYFVTNKRVILYNPKKGFRGESIGNILGMQLVRVKGDYGDITFNFIGNTILEAMQNGMMFEGVKNPQEIVDAIRELNDNINYTNDNIEVDIKVSKWLK